ncbi:MAG TPA: M90 family metallopeptidase [Chitinophagaceae bacterium]
MIITVLQILIVLALIVIVIVAAFRPRRKNMVELPENHRGLLNDYVRFYARLDEDGKKDFEKRLQHFLSAVKITSANAVIEDLDVVLIGAAAIIPVYHIRDWEYINLREVLVYPGNFNTDFDQQGPERQVSGMVGTGALQNVLILSKWELRQGFVDSGSGRNTAIHEFVHLVDKMDGTFDGVPEILLERKFVPEWKQLLQETIESINRGESDIDLYGGSSAVECFAVISEYFFEQPDTFAARHPRLNFFLRKIYVRD